MKSFWLICGIGIFCFTPDLAAAASPSTHYIYSGDLTPALNNEAPCDAFAPPGLFEAKVFFAGPSGRTIVVNLKNAEIQSPLNGQNFVGLYGTGDFEAEKILKDPEGQILLKMSGFADFDFLIFELKVEKTATDGSIICTAAADYSGTKPHVRQPHFP